MRKPETEAEKRAKKKAATAKATVDKKAEAEAKKKAKAELETVELRLHTPFIAVQKKSFSTDNKLHCICLTGKTGHERQKKQSQTGQASRRNSRTGRDLTAEL